MFHFFLAPNWDLWIIFSYICLLKIVAAAFDFVVVSFLRNCWNIVISLQTDNFRIYFVIDDIK